LKRYNGKINLKKIVFFALMIIVLTGCRGNDDDYYYNDQYYRDDYYYGDDYYSDVYYDLIDDLDRFNIYYLSDIEEMVLIAWDYDAYVEVEYLDRDSYHLEMGYITNDQMLTDFLDEIYYEEVRMLDAEVLENEYYELFLIFTVKEY